MLHSSNITHVTLFWDTNPSTHSFWLTNRPRNWLPWLHRRLLQASHATLLSNNLSPTRLWLTIRPKMACLTSSTTTLTISHNPNHLLFFYGFSDIDQALKTLTKLHVKGCYQMPSGGINAVLWDSNHPNLKYCQWRGIKFKYTHADSTSSDDITQQWRRRLRVRKNISILRSSNDSLRCALEYGRWL